MNIINHNFMLKMQQHPSQAAFALKRGIHGHDQEPGLDRPIPLQPLTGYITVTHMVVGGGVYGACIRASD